LDSISNETINPIKLKIDFPLDSFEFPLSSGNYMKLLIPSETMTLDKASLSDNGLAVKSFLDTGINRPPTRGIIYRYPSCEENEQVQLSSFQ
jgi:hypothetical protein